MVKREFTDAEREAFLHADAVMGQPDGMTESAVAAILDAVCPWCIGQPGGAQWVERDTRILWTGCARCRRARDVRARR